MGRDERDCHIKSAGYNQRILFCKLDITKLNERIDWHKRTKKNKGALRANILLETTVTLERRVNRGKRTVSTIKSWIHIPEC